VAPDMIRKLGGRVRSSSPKKRTDQFESSDNEGQFSRGDQVEVKHRGRWCQGRIRKSNTDGTYDIRLEDDEELDGVSATKIRISETDLIKEESWIVSPELIARIRKVIRKYHELSVDSTARLVFSSFDQRNLGVVSKREFKSALRKIYDISGSKSKDFNDWISPEEFLRLVTALTLPDLGSFSSKKGSVDGMNNGISYDHFIGFANDSSEDQDLTDLFNLLQENCFKKLKYKINILTGLFERYDKSQKGFLRLTDFMKVIRKIYSSITSREESLLQSKFDLANDSVIDYYQFIWWVSIGQDMDQVCA
jgi:hypothetical protein